MCNCSASVQGYLEWFMKDCLDRITKSVILTTDLGYVWLTIIGCT